MMPENIKIVQDQTSCLIVPSGHQSLSCFLSSGVVLTSLVLSCVRQIVHCFAPLTTRQTCALPYHAFSSNFGGMHSKTDIRWGLVKMQRTNLFAPVLLTLGTVCCTLFLMSAV